MDVIYHDIRSPGIFGSIDKLRRYARKRRKDIVDYLKSQDAYTLHKPIGDDLFVEGPIRRVSVTYTR